MNNNQFRRLILNNDAAKNGTSPPTTTASTAPSTLGAKKSSFMPMTPRTLNRGGSGSGSNEVDFARQVRERNTALHPSKNKKFKSVAPKGVKYAAGYTDRAKARAEREEDGEEEDKAKRVAALEEQMKLGQISVETFETLRDRIAGGDAGSTHLVKGLDWKLLERVRRGEDVLGGRKEGEGEEEEATADVDEELDKLGEREVEAVRKEKVEKKGSMAAPQPLAGTKRTRDELMAELKAQRKAAAEAKAAAPLLDSRWRKAGDPGKSRIEIDHKGREVLITVDEDGVVKKKVRKVMSKQGEEDRPPLADMPDESKPVLGADAAIPETAPAPVADDEDEDIFAGVGTSYDPLGNEDDNDDDSSDDEDTEKEAKPSQPKPNKPKEETTTAAQPTTTPTENTTKPQPRNYFKDTPSTTAEEEPAQDRMAGMQELLKKAAKMDSTATGEGTNDDPDDEDEEARAARLKKRAAMLAQQDRDEEDLDMGFGSSRFDDGEDEGEDGKVKLSEWRGGDGDGEDDGEGGKRAAGKKGKRKPKKRKGDGNNMADIMRVLDGRKAAAGGSK
ncbi:hypothetical protein BDY17DRAFT_306471 [Neohortaea acidophila]|uniref:RED-like N-terminal domain-containing protein n=1 Tax=Neohortaea acidophila TaxID=245834 RepID=A0A6A6Q3P4_9PEZI|nr:uncharacterized protein BDY17DRAFT_306471 [Neohortaea acidophila]KAF2487020.1 hypothetical protein BDY17DRAFT_306471 [Neohortaea acidophila]